MSHSSFPWILRDQPQEELWGISSFLFCIILTFQHCFFLAGFQSRLVSLASAWAVKASREIYSKYLVFFCFVNRYYTVWLKDGLKWEVSPKRLGSLMFSYATRIFLLQKPHLPPSSSSHSSGTRHTFHLGFPAERLLGEEFKALQKNAKGLINITTAAAVGYCQHNTGKRPVQIVRDLGTWLCTQCPT